MDLISSLTTELWPQSFWTKKTNNKKRLTLNTQLTSLSQPAVQNYQFSGTGNRLKKIVEKYCLHFFSIEKPL